EEEGQLARNLYGVGAKHGAILSEWRNLQDRRRWHHLRFRKYVGGCMSFEHNLAFAAVFLCVFPASGGRFSQFIVFSMGWVIRFGG
ncbi:hypothetical protein, partial [Tritonibacter scottomollicae]|uniref:hypothetical protein n=1 Tax=Tritonibacter scottomollicae TaxID=483013 RepID=UPI003AA97E7F